MKIFLDRDGIKKELLVDEHNWAEAHNSWQLVKEGQQSAVVHRG